MKKTRLAFLGAALVFILIGGLWLATVLKRRQHDVIANIDAHSPYEKSELQNWIKLLSSDDAIERKRAESELSNAGVFADSALNAAEATSVGTAKEAIQRLLNRRRFAAIRDLDYTQALPPGTRIFTHVPNIQQALEKSRQTAFGKLLMRPACDALRTKMWNELQVDEHGEPRQPPVEYFKGQFAAGVYDAGSEHAQKLGMLLEMKGTDPQGEYLDWSSKLLSNGGAIRDYKDIENLDAGPQKGAHARTGNSILFGSDADALHVLIDTVLTGRGVGSLPEVKAIHASLGPFPDAVLFADVPSIAHQILASRTATVQDANDDILELLFEKFGYAGASTTCTRDGFEDRIVTLLPQGPDGVIAACTAPAGAARPIDMFNQIPPDALAACMFYVDGAKLERAYTEFYNDVLLRRGADKKAVVGVAPLVGVLRGVEQTLGLKPGRLLGLIKGEVGLWLELKNNVDPANGDISGLITTPDENSAEELAKLLDTLNALHLPGVFTKSEYRKHTIHAVNAAKNGDAGRGLAWMVDKNRVYLASSVQSLKKQFDSIERHMPGLLKREPLQKALLGFNFDERAGSIVYIDSQALLTRAAETYFPQLLADAATAPELKEALKQLPPPVDVFKDFPPLLAFTVTRSDRAELVVHSPAPLLPLALAGFLSEREKHKRAEDVTAPDAVKRGK